MYKKQASMSLKGTPSMLPNNLTSKRTKHLAYAVAHKSVVCMNTVTSGGSLVQQHLTCKTASPIGSITVMQAKWCNVSGRGVLVFGTTKGIQMYEEDGSVMIFWHGFVQQENQAFSYFARGICSAWNRFICVGVSEGSILLFDIPKQGTEIKQHQCIDGKGVGITDLAGIQNKLVSADEDGTISIWQCDATTEKISEIRGSGIPCMSLALWNGYIAAAYSSGHIRIFDLSTAILKVEICAHSRCINALDVAPQSGLLLSVSEDSFARVWTLPSDFSSNKVQLAFQAPVPDSQLCGGRFLDESGQSFGVSGYDLAEIVVFEKK